MLLTGQAVGDVSTSSELRALNSMFRPFQIMLDSLITQLSATYIRSETQLAQKTIISNSYHNSSSMVNFVQIAQIAKI